jgi:hypothetical protein
MPVDIKQTESPNGSRENIKMRPDAATMLRMYAAKLTLIFGRRVTFNETFNILLGPIDDSTLDQMARNYAQSHGIELPAARS